MGCLHFVAPVYLGRYYLPIPLSLVARHWYLFGLLPEYRVLPSDVVVLPKPGFAWCGVPRPWLESALVSQEQLLAIRPPERCWWLSLIK